MVSPCKKKTDKKIKQSAAARNRGGASGSEVLKPLSGKKIYLDVRNPATARRLERQIILLGGGVETFLASDVSHLVTDRKSAAPPPDSSSLSPANAALAHARTRSRGEAMLSRVRQGGGSVTRPTALLDDLLERAGALGVAVCPLVRFGEYVSKLLRRADRASGHHKTRELRGTYLKLETGLRPEVRVLSGWPRIDLASDCGSAFAVPQNDPDSTSRMTRKSGGKALCGQTKNSSSGAAAAGYCEVCRVNYDWVEEHVSGVAHIKAVTDPTQYRELDSLISASSGATASWLGQRKSSRLRSPTPLLSSPPPPTILNCNGHVPLNNLQGLPNGIRSGERVARSNSAASPASGRRGRVIRKRLSAEEKLIEDNRAYYKVEVLNSKLRSTGTLQRQLGSSGGGAEEEDYDEGEASEEIKAGAASHMGAVLGSSPLHNGQAPGSQSDSVVVRFKKVRKSELSALNDEAENFMFGDRETESHEATPVDTAESAARKKRRTHAELFINDNADYYKFELPGSRLRYQGTTLAHIPTPTKEETRLRSPPCDVPTRLRSAGKSPPDRRTANDGDDPLYHRCAGKSPSASPRYRRPSDEPPCHRLKPNRSPSAEEPAHRLRPRSNRSPPDDEPAHHHRHHHRLRSNRSPADEGPRRHRLRSARSPAEDEPLPRHRPRPDRSPEDDEPVPRHRLRSDRSPTYDEPADRPRSRSDLSPFNHGTRSDTSPTDEESSYRQRLRSDRSPVDEEPVHHHRLRSGRKSPCDEPQAHRSRWNRSPVHDEGPPGHRLRSGGRGSTDEEPSNHRLRSSRNLYDDESVKRTTEQSRPGLRSSSGTPPPIESKLRSCPGLSPIKERLTERPGLPSEEDLAPELSLTHTDITYAFEMSNTDPLSTQIEERQFGFKEELLPRHFCYPTEVLPCEMPYLDRLKLLTRRKRRISRCFDDRPRKSPRCHASTLAILSAVLPKCATTRDEGAVAPCPSTVQTEPSSTAEDEDTTASSLTVDSNQSDPSNETKSHYLRFLSHYASLLESVRSKENKTADLPNLPEDSCWDAPAVESCTAPPDFIWMMNNDKCPDLDACIQETFFNLRSFDLDSCNSSDCSEIFGFSEDGRSYFGRRKKKKRHNLTGWPKEKPRRKLLAYSKASRFIRSEPPMRLYAPQDPLAPKKRGRPRLYPPGMSPSILKIKLARENAMRRSSSLSPLKQRPSLKAHPL